MMHGRKNIKFRIYIISCNINMYIAPSKDWDLQLPIQKLSYAYNFNDLKMTS